MISESEIVPEISAGLIDAGDGAVAEALVDAMGTVSTDDISALVKRAQRHLDKDRIRRAERRAFMAGVLAPHRNEVQDCVAAVFGADRESDTKNNVTAQLVKTVKYPDDPAISREFGAMLRSDKRHGAAAAVYRRLLRSDRANGEYWRNLASIMRDEKEFDAALILARHVIGLRPENGWAHIQHGNILARLDRPEAAVRAYEMALEYEPDAKAVRAAIGRQSALCGDLPRAMRNFRMALHDDPKDWHSADGLAAALAATGQHAEALVWWRRIREMRPKSNTARRNLAAALLRREHWAAGRALLADDVAKPDAGAAPAWDGRPASGTIAVYHRRSDPPVRTLMGMAAVRNLAAAGHIVLCSLPPRLADLMARPPASLGLVEDDANGARNSAFGGSAVAYLPLADAIMYSETHAPPHTPWLTGAGDTPREQIERVVFVSAKKPSIPGLTVDDIRAHVTEYFDVRAVYADARPSIDKAVASLKGADMVVTDDSLTALAAAGIGLPSTVIVPGECDWWWMDRAMASPWSKKQTVIRAVDGMEGEHILDAVREAVQRSAVPPEFRPPVRPETGSEVLFETVERLSPLFEPQQNRTLVVQKLTGGTRNKVYRLGADTGDRVLRLGRFPSPRKHFYAKESSNMRLAADAGLAPRVDFTDTLDGSMLIEFVDGEIMRSKSIRKAENATAIAHLYRRLHQLPGFRDKFDIFEKIERNVERLRRAKSATFSEQETFNDLMVRIGGILQINGVPHYATHNDPLTRNFIRHGERMMIIDWECSGLGDPHWEVAALSAQAGLEPDVWHQYVTAYFGSEGHPGICRIPLFEAACRYFWWTDALCSGVKRPDGNSWRDKAGRWWNWFTDVVSDKGFEKAISAAETYRWELSHSPASQRFRDDESDA